MELIDELINELIEEDQEYKIEKLPINEIEKKILYRSLSNIRQPKPVDIQYVKKENEYLQVELKKKCLTKVEEIEVLEDTQKEIKVKQARKIALWKGDITTLRIDAIVNAANSQGLGCFVPCHKCIDNQIHSSAGIQLRLACNEIMKKIGYYLSTGEAFLTEGYNLPATYVIHTVGPIIYDKVTTLEEEQLKKCYINSLELAIQNKIKTIAFPCISTGEFKFPKEIACKIAVKTVDQFLNEHKEIEKVVFNVYSQEDYEIYERYM